MVVREVLAMLAMEELYSSDCEVTADIVGVGAKD